MQVTSKAPIPQNACRKPEVQRGALTTAPHPSRGTGTLASLDAGLAMKQAAGGAARRRGGFKLLHPAIILSASSDLHL